MNMHRLLAAAFAAALLASRPSFAAAEDASAPVSEAAAPIVAPAEAEIQKLPDNDVYLITPSMWTVLNRYYAGESLDLDAELARLIRESPHVFSIYFWAGMAKVRRMMIAPGKPAYKAGIEELFSVCLDKARRAQSLPKFKFSGQFYESMCEMGLAMYYGVEGRYFTAGPHAQTAMRLFEKIKAARPNLHAVLLLDGMYNFYTGKFGFFTKLLLRLIGITPGDTQKGTALISKAAATESPWHWFATVYAIYAFTPNSGLKKLALQKADVMVGRYPNNYYSHLMRAYVLESLSRYPEALAANERGRRLLPGPMSQYKDVIQRADIFLMDVRTHYERAMLRRDGAALDFLFRASNDRQAEYADAPLLANMYLGHLYSQAGLDAQAMAFYEKMQTFSGAEWMRDLGKKYEARPMRKRRPLKKEIREPLKAFLLSRPDVKA
ncbi:MAG: hypothetical protein C4523_12590 [Myxococcales bacterium]|nr:MAG: hypothetical protein C4523_12590 [Myxococcales bacterium]